MAASEKSIVILTGAGISAESGLPTFRDANGLWEGYRFEEVASPEAFKNTPELVQRFYNLRRAALATVESNAAHHALARLQRDYPGKVTLITQNVDDLHERAGSTDVIHMHGELRHVFCAHCGHDAEWERDLEVTTPCPACQRICGMRPQIVWFGEIPYRMGTIETALMSADVFVAIGTSGHVYPAAGFVRAARSAGAETCEINNEETLVSSDFQRHRTGPATREVSAWVEEILNRVGR